MTTAQLRTENRSLRQQLKVLRDNNKEWLTIEEVWERYGKKGFSKPYMQKLRRSGVLVRGEDYKCINGRNFRYNREAIERIIK
jgi:hypothetical protein